MRHFYRSSDLRNCVTKISDSHLLHNTQLDQLKLVLVRPNTTKAGQSTIVRTKDAAGIESSRSKTKKSMSSAMKYYLEKKREHDVFIANERSEFELGKKHLANIMGMNYEAMTQEDIDKAIAYLFPSGLYDPEARPKMKPPEEVLQCK